jgi:acyl carrier protein
MSVSSHEEHRLGCFPAVSPDISRDQLRDATPRSVEAWDSVVLVTGIAAIEEEFGVSVSPDAYSELHSSSDFLRKL